MGLFDEQVQKVRGFLEAQREEGRVREFSADNPSIASLSFLTLSEDDGVADGRISLVGPDIAEVGGKGVPFARALLVSGDFTDEYESYREVREAVFDTVLEGFMVRTMPSRQSIWCRVSGEAVARGFSLKDLGEALIWNLKQVGSVRAAEAVFVTSSPADVEELAPAAEGTRRVVAALMKMYEEANFDCETCEYRDVCDEVMDLKKIRNKLEERKKARG